MLRIVHDAGTQGELEDERVDLDELCRLAAREMIAVALEAERRAYLECHAEELDAAGRRLVVGNGYASPREITTAAGGSRYRRRGSTTAAQANASPRPSCRRTCGARRKSPRCCRSSTCAAVDYTRKLWTG